MTLGLQAEVLVVGCGPIGLWLALELHRAKVDVLVIDAIASRSHRLDFPKSLTLSAGSLEAFNSRGEAQQFVDRGLPLPTTHFGFLGGVPLGHEVLGVAHSCFLLLEQTETEDILLEKCRKAGVRFAWRTRFESLQQSEDWVDAKVVRSQNDGSQVTTVVRARYVVGCDGTHSTVRANAGFEVDHVPGTHLFLLTHPFLDEKTPKRIMAGVVPGGSTLMVPTLNGRYHVVASAQSMEDKNLPEEASVEQIKESMRLVHGTDYGLHSPNYTSTFTDTFRHSKSYQTGRVFLCGDASHQFPPAGGQGMNTGFADASNLAWKLCAALRGEESKATVDHLLGTYTTERFAAVEAVMDNVRVQMYLITAKAPEDFAMRKFIGEMMKKPEVSKALARESQSLGGPTAPFAPYWTAMKDTELHGAPPLVGSKLTHLALKPVGHTEGKTRNLEILDLSRFVLLVRKDQLPAKDLSRIAALRQVLNGYQDRASLLEEETVANHSKWDDVYAVLVRPDMHIAWIARGRESSEETAESLRIVMDYWWGSAR